MQQPMAVDLRFILAVIKINGNLERVGDQAVNIVQRVLDVLASPTGEFPVDVPRMGALVSAMIRDSLEAFISGDATLAQNVLERDDTVDSMKQEIESIMIEQMHRSPDLIQPALDTLLIARNLERMADHATNIAEDVIFWVRGADVRHLGSK
jgi:phosphate transport system protein